MGIDASRVKMAIKNQLESSGNAFESAEHLINAAFSVQREQERRSRYKFSSIMEVAISSLE